MSIAAIPQYLKRHDPALASPALRFGLLLPIWTSREDQEKHVTSLARKGSREGRELNDLLRSEGMQSAITALEQGRRGRFPGLWEKNDHAAQASWAQIIELNTTDRNLLAALAQRQSHNSHNMFNRDATACFEAISTAPFTTGLGNEHPLENGFAFLNPYGLPYLPGSGVKGVLRQAAKELADGQWGETHGWTDAAITALFGAEDANNARRGALIFHDVIPQLRGSKLMVEIMTPHQKHYYQDKAAPHDSGQPNPIKFLTIPPDTGFRFLVGCNKSLLQHDGLDLGGDNAWRPLLEAAFEHAFTWLGFGAKTAVGYGAMQRDHKAEQQRAQQAAEQDRQRAEQQALEAELADLPTDAAELKRQQRQHNWPSDKSTLIPGLSAWLEEFTQPSAQALKLAGELMDAAFPGIMENPDATQGKKNKPKYKPTQTALAKQLLQHKQ